MKKYFIYQLIFMGICSQIMTAEVMKSGGGSAHEKDSLSQKEWENIVKNSKPPEKLVVKDIDAKHDIIYLQEPNDKDQQKGSASSARKEEAKK